MLETSNKKYFFVNYIYIWYICRQIVDDETGRSLEVLLKVFIYGIYIKIFKIQVAHEYAGLGQAVIKTTPFAAIP